MISIVNSIGLLGIHSYPVHVEVDVSHGLPGFEMVGSLSGEVREAKERVRVALKNAKIDVPPMRITVNLSPADIRKEGTGYDLAIAMGMLASLKEFPGNQLESTVLAGELGLDGEVKRINGILPMVLEAKKQGMKRFILPFENGKEGEAVPDIEIIGVNSVLELLEWFRATKEEQKRLIPPRVMGRELLEERLLDKINKQGIIGNSVSGGEEDNSKIMEVLDFEDVIGQEPLKRAAEIAAAGFHHLLISGPPGAGKTMIAKRLPSIMPLLSLEESLEVSAIYSISGELTKEDGMITKRPFLSPHHTVTLQAIAGGGINPRPGVISMAHRGVLFLDELPEFNRAVIDVMRQPLEEKMVHIARACGTYTFPADFILVCAMNPCPCGYYPDRNRCNCSEMQIKRYLSRISGPILDRIDICVEASRLGVEQLQTKEKAESSDQIRERVLMARKRQEKRFECTGYHFNSQIQVRDMKNLCKLGGEELKWMEQVFEKMQISTRAYHRTIKVARTIADLAGDEDINCTHLSEAICYRRRNF